MTISIEDRNGVCRARVTGEMTIYHAAEMKGELLPWLDRSTEVEIDLSEVSEMDTAGSSCCCWPSAKRLMPASRCA